MNKKNGNIDNISCHHDGDCCIDGKHELIKIVPLNGTNQYIAPSGKEFWLNGERLGKVIYLKEYNKKLEIR